MLNDTQLMYRKAMEGGNIVAPDSLVNDQSKVREVIDVKQLVLSNARILYGSESRKFFDFVTGRAASGKYTCVLVCSLEGSTKILRKEVSNCPLGAARALADGLIKDTGLLFDKYDVGYQLTNQQGYRDEGEQFKLDEYKSAARYSGPVDDTKTLRYDYRNFDAPRGPAADGWSKRRRGDP
ncbi:hypothetical protein N0V90_010095 [Kalmusia sp. IMI 367209]|nr:hypothetical protein N0V90_010095 [Kalmusia sp. IMI 367209]